MVNFAVLRLAFCRLPVCPFTVSPFTVLTVLVSVCVLPFRVTSVAKLVGVPHEGVKRSVGREGHIARILQK